VIAQVAGDAAAGPNRCEQAVLGEFLCHDQGAL
jgi:hypothetical protein